MRGDGTQDLDWNLVRTFVAVVDNGSLAAAARAWDMVMDFCRA